MRRTWGRCPYCGESVIVEVTEREPGKIVEHSCEARSCEYAGCLVTKLKEEMVQLAGGEWHCPSHGLLLAARHLVALYRAERDADWTAISEIIGETLPDIVLKVGAQKARKTWSVAIIHGVPGVGPTGGRWPTPGVDLTEDPQSDGAPRGGPARPRTAPNSDGTAPRANPGRPSADAG